MSQQGDKCGSNACSVSGKRRRSCQTSSCTFQRAEGRNGDGLSLLPRKRTEPVRPCNGAGQGGKRKAHAEDDASGLPAKRSLAAGLGRTAACDVAPKRDVQCEPNGMIYVKAVQEVLSGRDHLQAGGLPVTAGPSSGRRPSLAVCPRSVSKTLAGGKRKGLDEEQQAAAQLPANKRARGQSTGSVPAPTPPRSSKQRARRQQQKERKREMRKASLRAARAEFFAEMNSLAEMMQKVHMKD